MPRKKQKPAYLLHKPTGQARVRIDGKDHYLGSYGSPDSREQYDDLVSEWLDRQDVRRLTLRMDDLALLFLRHAEKHYRKNGQVTSEVHCLRLVLRHVVAVHGRTRVRDFGPKALKQVRQSMIDAGYVRTSINTHVGRIRTMFRWAVAEELIPTENWQALLPVGPLERGRSEAKEADRVPPVPEEVVNATLPYLASPVAAMVRLQLFTGAKPGEVCRLRPCDITRGMDGVWLLSAREPQDRAP